jgi:Prokaryotic E2 family E
MEVSATISTPTLRRDFRLPAEDERYLTSSGWRWETVLDAGICRLILFDFPVPAGYNRDRVDLHLRIESGYPDVQIDMAYFHPPIARVSGRVINALSSQAFDGKEWQQWSRHRTSENPWRPGLDNVETHLELVYEWLAREVRA